MTAAGRVEVVRAQDSARPGQVPAQAHKSLKKYKLQNINYNDTLVTFHLDTAMAILRTVFALAAASLLTANATAATVDFDDRSEEPLFVDTSALTDRYAPLGITFSGAAAPANTAGGSILDQDGNFGFNALSGRNFLAFNTQNTGNVENIAFSTSFGMVSIWGASTSGGTFTMNAYDAGGTLLDSATANFAATWTQLSVASSGIARVELIGNNVAYAYDDLNVSAVPEPSTWGMLLVGAAMMGWLMRRRHDA
jgi:hypothetical protein